MYNAGSEELIMPNPHSLVMLVGDPKNYKPRVTAKHKKWENRLNVEQRFRRQALTAVGILESLANECGMTDAARLLMHASWHLENPTPRHNVKLDAFAIFMGEWAAKIRNAVAR